MRKELELLDSTKVSGTRVRAASGRRAPPRVGRGATRVLPPGGSDNVTRCGDSVERDTGVRCVLVCCLAGAVWFGSSERRARDEP
jgi:hypothetical protein